MSRRNPIWLDRRCTLCGERFDELEWDTRHSDSLADVHDDCCEEHGPCSR